MEITTELRMVWAWMHTRQQRLLEQQRDRDRGDGILVWVIMTALLAAAALAIVAIIVTKATDKANQTQVQ